MAIYKPSELRQFLESIHASPKKVLSQNFLIDGNIIRKIIEKSHIKPGDLVLEIGPGPGALTEALLQAGARVIAVEKDRVLAQALERFKTPEHDLRVFCEDIMEFPLEKELEALLSNQKAKVIANLPYHLTTPILARLVPLYPLISHLVVMVQDEVARRFVAQPNTPDYSSFSIFLRFFCNPHYGFTVSRNCFFPVPNVESAIVILELKEAPQIEDPDHFFLLTRSAFSQRRKMLRSSLRAIYSGEKISEALEALSLNPQARPENLSLEEWLNLYRYLRDHSKTF